MKSKINLRILREGKDTVCESVERGTMTFGSLFKKYPFPLITDEKMQRANYYKKAAFPVLFVNEHTFIGTPEVDAFITADKPIDEFVSGKTLFIQMRYRVPIIERPAFYGSRYEKLLSLSFSPELSEHVSLTAELGVPESYWDDFG